MYFSFLNASFDKARKHTYQGRRKVWKSEGLLSSKRREKFSVQIMFLDSGLYYLLIEQLGTYFDYVFFIILEVNLKMAKTTGQIGIDGLLSTWGLQAFFANLV